MQNGYERQIAFERLEQVWCRINTEIKCKDRELCDVLVTIVDHYRIMKEKCLEKASRNLQIEKHQRFVYKKGDGKAHVCVA